VRPYKKNLVDLCVTKEAVARALEVANALFLSLEGTFAEMGDAKEVKQRPVEEDVFERVSKRRFSATFENFNVHAAVCIAANQDEARERLVRYCAPVTERRDRGLAGAEHS